MDEHGRTRASTDNQGAAPRDYHGRATARQPKRFAGASGYAFFLALLMGVGAFRHPLGAESLAGSAAKPDAEIVIDFTLVSAPLRHAASGVLHSIRSAAPSDERLLPLRLRNFRGRADENYLFREGFHDRLTGLGVEHIQVVLSDSYGYPNGFCGWPVNAGALKCWEDNVERTARECMRRGIRAEYDIWNEPDIPYFWGADRAAWFEAWKRGVRKVRAVAPEAPVVGPSISHFNRDFLRDFLVYAKANDCLPDILSWHELGARTGRAIPTHATQASALLREIDIDVERLSINEIIPQNRQFNPATALSYLQGIEDSGVESACHSCWGDEGGSNCDNDSLDGLLTPDTRLPRPVWWVYKSYAELAGERVVVQFIPNGKADRARAARQLAGLSTWDAETSTLRVLVGSTETTRSLSLGLRVASAAGRSPRYQPFSPGGRLTVDSIPDTADAPLEQPRRILETDVPEMRHSTFFQSLPDLPAGCVFLIRIVPFGNTGTTAPQKQPTKGADDAPLTKN